MTNNDILRRLRYVFNYSNEQIVNIFALADHEATQAEVTAWLKKDEDEAFQSCPDVKMAIFLNGLINEKRGKKEGEQPEPEKKLNNNIVLRKLKIALNLQADEVLEILSLADFQVSKHELSALFRKQGHKHYRECKDQILRNFLKGIQVKYRDKAKPAALAEPIT